MAITGIERNIPDKPQIISPIIIPTKDISAFKRTLEPTIAGNKKLASTACIQIVQTATVSVWLMVPVAKVTNVLSSNALNIPMYGIMFKYTYNNA